MAEDEQGAVSADEQAEVPGGVAEPEPGAAQSDPLAGTVEGALNDIVTQAMDELVPMSNPFAGQGDGVGVAPLSIPQGVLMSLAEDLADADEAQVAMDGSPAVSLLMNHKNTPRGEDAGPFGLILWQCGPVQEVGVNGTTIEDVLDVLIARLEGFQRGPFACAENAEVLLNFRTARRVMDERTARRQAQGVEGRNQPHV